MLYLHDLRAKLQERRKRLHRTDRVPYETELRIFLNYVADHSHLNSIVRTLEASESVDFEEWKSEVANSRLATFPPSASTRAKLCHNILEECADAEDDNAVWHWGGSFTTESNIIAAYEALNDAVLDPFVDYLQDSLEETGDVLAALERFKLKAEWFQQRQLFERYSSDTRNGERNLDMTLREALFDAGVDYPFSQPASPSGNADIVSMLGTDDPLVLEIKIFDPTRSRGTAAVVQGFHQVVRYAQDYQQSVGYLVVFNCSDGALELPSESDSSGFPPRIVVDGRIYFLLTVDINPDRRSASRESPISKVTIAYHELVGS